LETLFSINSNLDPRSYLWGTDPSCSSPLSDSDGTEVIASLALVKTSSAMDLRHSCSKARLRRNVLLGLMHHPMGQLSVYMGMSEIDKEVAEATANGLSKPREYKQTLLAYEYLNLELKIHLEYLSKKSASRLSP